MSNRPIAVITIIVSLLGLFGVRAIAQSGIPQAGAFDVAVGNIEIESDDTDFNHQTGIATAKGNVNIKYGEVEIFAQKAEYHTSSGDIFLEEGVEIYQGALAYKGNAAVYNLKTKKITANELKSGMDPIFYQSDELDTDASSFDKISMKNGFFTTHDSATPNYHMKAKKIVVYPEDPDEPGSGKVIFHKVTIYAGKTPVMWLPYLAQAMDQDLGYHFIPGYRTAWGGFLLNRYGVMVGDHTLATYRLDLRSARGAAGGIDLLSVRHRENENFGNFTAYYAYDTDPQKTHTGRTRSQEVDNSRYRVNLQHRIYLPGPDESTLYLDVDFNKISDGFFYEDFFPEEYRIDPQPDNLVNLVKRGPRGTFSLLGRFRANDFYRVDERLPEAALDITTQPFFKTGLFYSGNTSFGVYKEKPGTLERDRIEGDVEKLESRLSGALPLDPEEKIDPDDPIFGLSDDEARDQMEELLKQLSDFGFTRFHTYHQLNLPKTLFGWLNVNPKVGFGATSYSDVDGTTLTRDDAGELVKSDAPGSDSRIFGHAGIDVSFKLSKDYADASMPKLGVDGLRHIFQPYLNYSFVSSEDVERGIGKIDRYSPTTRLRPIDLPQFTTIDEIQDWNILRSGVVNRLQTQRDGVAYNWLELNTYFDTYGEDPEFDRDFSNLFNELTWRPLPWLEASIESQVPVFNSELDFTELNTELRFMPTRNFEFWVGNRYLKDHPFFEDSSLIDFGTYWRLSDRWGVGTRHRYEIEDSTMEWQQYTLQYDLSSWTAGVGALVRDNRSGEDEFGIVLTLTLKAFPQLSIPVEMSPGGGGGDGGGGGFGSGAGSRSGSSNEAPSSPSVSGNSY